MDFSFNVLHEKVNGYENQDQSYDVEIFYDGKRYAAWFSTIENIQNTMDRHKSLKHRGKDWGECNGGEYFWAADMIIVRQLSREIIEETIRDIISEGTHETAFQELPERDN